jgi:hypothetical protein
MKINRKTSGMNLKKSFIVNLSGKKPRQRYPDGSDTTTITEDTSTTTSIITVTHLA